MEGCDFNSICRICLNGSPNKDLSLKNKTFKVDYYFLLNTYASMQAEINDSLPKKMCKKCEKILINYYKFRNIVRENDIKLKEIFETNKMVRKTDKTENLATKIEINEIYSENEENYDESDDKNFEDEKDSIYFDEFAADTNQKKNDKTCVCQVCGKTYKGNLNIHMRTHTGEKPYQCQVCGKRFRMIGHLNQHSRIHTGDRTFECEICHKKFTQETNLKSHGRTHSGEKPYVCSFCGKSFAQSSNLSVHTRTHTGETPYKCDICDKSFRQSCTLKEHVRFFHEKQKNIECELCKKKFARNYDLKNHLLKHSGSKPHGCKICPKTFRYRSHLNRHVVQQHQNI